MSDSMIHIRDASLAHGGRPILHGIDLSIARAEKVALVGPSGVGKSSLLQAICGLAPLSSGAITIDGRAVGGPVAAVTMMLQRPALLPWATAYENVALGLRFSGQFRQDAAKAERRVRDLLSRVGLADRDGARPSELSGGEQQRIALARALAPSPQVLLLDEPFSALDAETRNRLRQDVDRLTSDNGITVILVTHDLADATALCRRIVRLAGRPAVIASDATIDRSPDRESAPLAEAA